MMILEETGMVRLLLLLEGYPLAMDTFVYV